jgi:hypothetical protein
MSRKAALMAVLALLTTLARADGPPADPGERVGFSRQIQPILNAGCLDCHFYGRSIGNLDLQPAKAWDSLVGVWSTQTDMPRVDPGDPDNSYLVHKLQGTHLAQGGSGTRMPPFATPWSPRQMLLLETWIRGGAKDD